MIKHLAGLPGNETSLNSTGSTLKMQKSESASMVSGANVYNCVVYECHSLHPVNTWRILDPALAAPSREIICNSLRSVTHFCLLLSWKHFRKVDD